MAGSLGLNKRFEEAVREVVGEDQFYQLKKTVGWSKALNDFDKTIKPAFNGDLDEVHFVSFPKAELEDDIHERLTDNCWEMTGYVVPGIVRILSPHSADVTRNVLQHIFEPIVKDVLRLVDEQVQGALAKGGQGLKVIHCLGFIVLHRQPTDSICVGHLSGRWVWLKQLPEGAT
jgi:hypothetical protein